MSGGLIGLDVQQVNQLGDKLHQASTQIKDIVHQLNSALHGTQWVGHDGDQFRDEWTSQHVTQLNNVATALEQAGTQAKKNASAQEQTSSAL
jgi:uncharacterized protein YukE